MKADTLQTITPKQLRRAADLKEKIEELKSEFRLVFAIKAAAPPSKAEQSRFSEATRRRLGRKLRARWKRVKAAGRSTL